MRRYNPKEIEPKWQKTWEHEQIYRAEDKSTKPKKYVLEYFPYPSGAAMHVGHVRNYTIGDVIARFNRMNGHNVLHPMGWDAFGLPAENYAIQHGISPKEAIKENTARFRRQLMQMGFSYDWSREVNSSDPEYYKWTQWLFLLLFKRGLAYQQESLQWWCPFDKTVLANEQVENGRCWRCGNEVEKKALKQWFFKITDYADRLLSDLDDLNWSDAIKTMQRNWIGKSRGAEIDFKIEGHEGKSLKVFTTRPDTIYGATFMVLAPEHPLVKEITTAQYKHHVSEYVKAAQSASDIEREKTDREKTGVFTGAYAVNPISGSKIPIWIADYVLAGYGTGAIMAVPAHDERDYAFAIKYELPIDYVIEPVYGEPEAKESESNSIVAVLRNPKTNKVLMLDWGPRQKNYGGKIYIGGSLNEGEDEIDGAIREIKEETGFNNIKHVVSVPYLVHNHFYSNVKDKNFYVKIRGLLFDLIDEESSATEFDEGEKGKFKTLWADINESLELVDDPAHKEVALAIFYPHAVTGEGLANFGDYLGKDSSRVREEIIKHLEANGSGKEVINFKMRDWLISRQRYWGAPIPIIHCAKDGPVAVPDDDLPVVLPDIDKIEPSGDGHSPLANIKSFVEVKCPKCGGKAERETDTMDGFACSSWYFLRFADPHNSKEAFSSAKAKYWLPVDDYIGGAEHAVMHLLYARFWTKVMYDAGLISFSEPFATLRNHGMILAPNGAKMSKSKGNTIEPDGLIEQGYGADSIRIMELFIGPWNQAANWSVEGLGGAYRFLQRVWNLTLEFKEAKTAKSEPNPELKRLINAAIKKVSEDMLNLNFNTAIAALMETVNELYLIKAKDAFSAKEWSEVIERLLKLLAPIAPHLCEELWHELGHSDSVHLEPWPGYDESVLTKESVTIAVQINGKIRGEVVAEPGADEDQVMNLVKQNNKLSGYLKSGELRKTILVVDKLISLVIN